MSAKLSRSFYLSDDVVGIAKSLLGKIIATNINNKLTSGIIVETEAYSWIERGCHAYQQKMTTRNEPMFNAGGISYVYLCYGIHELFNVVTNKEGIAEAVLIRALEPLEGIDEMLNRTKSKSLERITSGPGKLTRALGITRKHNRTDLLTGAHIWIEHRNRLNNQMQIESSTRIGLNFKSDDALLPWRFTVKGSQWISK
jgi:DNA-3-methyladenine glycosylase